MQTKFTTFIVALLCVSLVPLFGPSGFLLGASPQLPLDLLLELRVPRTILAFVVGAGLSLCGIAMQSFFRNDLASPFTIGISSTAAFGACLGIFFSLSSSAVYITASLGACLGIIVLFYISKYATEGRATLLLLGICLGVLASAGIFLLQLLAGPENSFNMIRWLAGDLSTATYHSLVLPSIATILFTTYCFTISKKLDLLQIGDNFAVSHGVSIRTLSRTLIFGTAVLVGIFISTCGPIGFLGLIIPNLVRRNVGAIHEKLLFYSFLWGGVFLVLCDLGSRTILYPIEIPIGLITSLIGAPLFMFLLLRQSSPR